MLTDKQVKVVLDHTAGLRHAERDRVMVLLSVKAGLRAKEIAGLTWAMVTDADGEIATDIRLTNASSKGSNGGRTIPMHRDVRTALVLSGIPSGRETPAPNGPWCIRSEAGTTACPPRASRSGSIGSRGPRHGWL